MSDRDFVPSIPKVHTVVEWSGWGLFIVVQLILIATIAVCGFDRKGDVGTIAKSWIVPAFPILLGVILAFAATCTFAAANGFGQRFRLISEKIREGAKEKESRREIKCDQIGHLVVVRPAATELAVGVAVEVREKYLPAPYEVAIHTMRFSLEVYLGKLTEERTAARKRIAALAGALGATFAGGMLVFGRLVTHLNP